GVVAAGRLPIHSDWAGPVGHETTLFDKGAVRVDRRRAIPRCQRDDEIAMDCRYGIRRQDPAAIWHARKGCNSALNIGRVLETDGHYLDRERRRQGYGGVQEVVIGGSSWGWPRGRRA